MASETTIYIVDLIRLPSSGQMIVCSVSCDSLRAGHTHQFSVTASASGEKGMPSPCTSVGVI